LRRFVSGLAALVVCIPAGFLTYAGATAVNMPLDQPELHVVKDWLISKRGRPPGAGND